MDNQRSPLLEWAYYCQGKSMDELRQTLLLTTMELETTRLRAEEELRMRDDQLTHLKLLLSKAICERDGAEESFQRLLLEKLLLQQQIHQFQQKQSHQSPPPPPPPVSGISSLEDGPRRGFDSNNGFSSSDSDESIVSSPVIEQIPATQLLPLPPPAIPPPSPAVQDPTMRLALDKPLPEKGKLLQAVMKAGPLLQTLLLAGPLPQWRHPPPPLDSYQIPSPPVGIPSTPAGAPAQILHQDSLVGITACRSGNIDDCVRMNRKREVCGGSDIPQAETKYQRVVL